jgi:sulfur carrier protein ThiS
MKIDLNLFATLTKYMPVDTGGKPCAMDIHEGTTIKSFLQDLAVPEKEIKLIFLNGLHAKGDEILKEGDRIGVFPPIGGG